MLTYLFFRLAVLLTVSVVGQLVTDGIFDVIELSSYFRCKLNFWHDDMVLSPIPALFEVL